MIKQIELTLEPYEAFNDEIIKAQIIENLKVYPFEIKGVRKLKRSIDSRTSEVVFKLLCDVYINENPPETPFKVEYKPVTSSKRVIIVGSGPAGLFAALRLIELGIKPVIIERGKDVVTRRRDIRAIQQDHIVNPDSNYCFGEGGAGTFSDGKLYTRSTKKGDIQKVLGIFVQHGAVEDILIDAHPHVGSNKLPGIIANIRETILRCGGEINFEKRVTDLIINANKIQGVVTGNSEEFLGDAVILATGHSARDIYYLLDDKDIALEWKPFALGVRIEHPQALINEIMYHSNYKNPLLPSASYNCSTQLNGKGIYSFCMCPGGIIVPSATAPGELVVNGMSLSKRNSPFANAGFVVAVDERELYNYRHYEHFAALEYQKEVEKIAFEAGGKTQKAPAQRITDFLNGKVSDTLPNCSYIPGIVSAPLHELLPKQLVDYMRKALPDFESKMPGYITEEAQILAAETRTSSPIRIPRDRFTFMHAQVNGLFPAGEGAGYAGGIVSSAFDGENCANAVSKFLGGI
jgi:hypothetical protein